VLDNSNGLEPAERLVEEKTDMNIFSFLKQANWKITWSEQKCNNKD
jgi:hypothetical protein